MCILPPVTTMVTAASECHQEGKGRMAVLSRACGDAVFSLVDRLCGAL